MTSESEDYGRRTTYKDSGDSGYFTAAGSDTTLSEPEDRLGGYEEDRLPQWHGGLSFGLLVLRLVLGGTLGVHGVQKVFGIWGGPGIGEFSRILGDQGYTSQLTVLSWLGGVTEIAGGVLLIFGLFTPVAAAALLAVVANAVYLKYQAGSGYFLGNGDGYEFHVVLGGIALALLFTGPGGVSIDTNTPWRRRPVWFGVVGLVLAAAVVVALTYFFRR
ncbi:DoxX family protein [Amycolatopsis sp. GM8]|uniref:DoxX family protein n=1 Tax=Amycolatopsis sp. GM8 TaxID=2896530 RepID=UPI001F45A27E|nr:DoxX family protein [Amycolatopsis sp. GM8]